MNANHPKQTTTSTGLRRKTRWGGETSNGKRKRGERDAAAREQHAPPDAHYVRSNNPTLTYRSAHGQNRYGRSHRRGRQAEADPSPQFSANTPQWRSQTPKKTLRIADASVFSYMRRGHPPAPPPVEHMFGHGQANRTSVRNRTVVLFHVSIVGVSCLLGLPNMVG